MTLASDAARALAAQGGGPRTCPVCGRTFHAGSQRGRYCSPACKYRARANRAGRTAREGKTHAS